ncbi:hypothetical protein QFC22_003910 [Naganishia vaughanmartiniae]|uniref:Uncharacterized protein n=1 Tax=Naganishia vaughanmartiniae TaxID=1424756 RepID=A0ACC2X3S8_9TREE|nr:hypothetical protein QFC22_003910 [Naganishia vaughanmartiniae]
MVRLGIADDQPVGVQQWRGLIAINYPARKFGITRHMTAEEAKKKCPSLRTVHVATYREGDAEPGRWDDADPRTHKVSLDPYRRESAKIIAIFKSMVTEGEVEKASIDEAFIDFSTLAIKEILRRHPHLAVVPSDAPHGLDSPLPPPPPLSWTEAGNVFPIKGEEKDPENNDDHDGNDGESSEGAGGWEDVALCIGAELMAKVRNEVHTKLVKERTATKSMLASKNVSPFVKTREDGYHWLSVLAGELYVRLRDAREITDGLWPKSLVLGTRQATESQRSRQTTFPFTKDLSADYITKYANKLWDEVADSMGRASSSKPMKINNLALSFYGLERLEGGQQGIEGFFGNGLASTSKPMLKAKRSRSGSPMIESSRRIQSDSGSSTKKQKIDREVIEILDDSDEDIATEDSLKWTCPKCSHVFSVAAEQDKSSDATSTKQARLSNIKREHQDFHVAKELHKRERLGKVEESHGVASTTKSKRSTKPAKKPGGIKAFFSPFDTSSDSKN